jgi:hypothetical protein
MVEGHCRLTIWRPLLSLARWRRAELSDVVTRSRVVQGGRWSATVSNGNREGKAKA